MIYVGNEIQSIFYAAYLSEIEHFFYLEELGRGFSIFNMHNKPQWTKIKSKTRKMLNILTLSWILRGIATYHVPDIMFDIIFYGINRF